MKTKNWYKSFIRIARSIGSPRIPIATTDKAYRKISKIDLRQQYDETSRTVRRLHYIIVGFSFYCLIVIGTPDSEILNAKSAVVLPLAGTSISLRYFLLIGPLTLIILTVYMHIFVGHLYRLPRIGPAEKLPVIFNLDHRGARIASTVMLYWLTPLMVGMFAWKGLPFSFFVIPGFRIPSLVLLSFLLLSGLLVLQLEREGTTVSWTTNVRRKVVLAVLFLAIVVISPVANDLSRKLDLRDADLSGRSLNDYRLDGAQLDRSVLSNAEMIMTSLKYATLRDANLANADLTMAFMIGSNLRGANLRNANLSGAVLWDADLSAADLTGTRISGQQLAKAWSLHAASIEKSVKEELEHDCPHLFVFRETDAPRLSRADLDARISAEKAKSKRRLDEAIEKATALQLAKPLETRNLSRIRYECD